MRMDIDAIVQMAKGYALYWYAALDAEPALCQVG
jgi:hypothetical protein